MAKKWLIYIALWIYQNIISIFMTNKTKLFFLKIIIHLSAFLPLANLYYQGIADDLGVDPVETVINFTGIGALNLLLITLTITPLANVLKQGYLVQTRRVLGLYAFVYALCHLVNFIAFELQFDGALFISEVIKRPYISVGMVAFLLLSALAITSLNSLKRKMGNSWQRLHNLSYVIIILVIIHFYWSVKSSLISPILYFVLAAILLLFRYKKIKRIVLSILA